MKTIDTLIKDLIDKAKEDEIIKFLGYSFVLPVLEEIGQADIGDWARIMSEEVMGSLCQNVLLEKFKTARDAQQIFKERFEEKQKDISDRLSQEMLIQISNECDLSRSVFRVAVLGGTGVGKSSLINKLANRAACEVGCVKSQTKANERVIIEIEPEGNTTIVEIWDTQGYLDTEGKNMESVYSTLDKCKDFDVILLVIQSTLKEVDIRLYEAIIRAGKKCIIVVNHVDILQNPRRTELERTDYVLEVKDRLRMELVDKVQKELQVTVDMPIYFTYCLDEIIGRKIHVGENEKYREIARSWFDPRCPDGINGIPGVDEERGLLGRLAELSIEKAKKALKWGIAERVIKEEMFLKDGFMERITEKFKEHVEKEFVSIAKKEVNKILERIVGKIESNYDKLLEQGNVQSGKDAVAKGITCNERIRAVVIRGMVKKLRDRLDDLQKNFDEAGSLEENDLEEAGFIVNMLDVLGSESKYAIVIGEVKNAYEVTFCKGILSKVKDARIRESIIKAVEPVKNMLCSKLEVAVTSKITVVVLSIYAKMFIDSITTQLAGVDLSKEEFLTKFLEVIKILAASVKEIKDEDVVALAPGKWQNVSYNEVFDKAIYYYKINMSKGSSWWSTIYNFLGNNYYALWAWESVSSNGNWKAINFLSYVCSNWKTTKSRHFQGVNVDEEIKKKVKDIQAMSIDLMEYTIKKELVKDEITGRVEEYITFDQEYIRRNLRLFLNEQILKAGDTLISIQSCIENLLLDSIVLEESQEDTKTATVQYIERDMNSEGYGRVSVRIPGGFLQGILTTLLKRIDELAKARIDRPAVAIPHQEINTDSFISECSKFIREEFNERLLNKVTNKSYIIQFGQILDANPRNVASSESSISRFLGNIDLSRKSFGRSLLYVAIDKSHVLAVRLLIAKGADPCEKDGDGRTAFTYAMEGDDKTEIVEALTYNGEIKAYEDNEDETVLTYAIKNNKVRTMEFLIRRHIATEVPDKEGNTPLISAVIWDKPDVIRLLIENGTVDTSIQNIEGDTALTEAIKLGRGDLSAQLVKLNANVSTPDRDDYTPLENALRNRMNGVVELLVRVNTAMHISTVITKAIRNNEIEYVDCLLNYQIDINAPDKDGNPPLIVAIGHTDPRITSFLIDRGADVNVYDKNGNTSLILSMKRPDLEVATLLLSKGANVNWRSSTNRTALNHLLRLKKVERVIEKVELLISSGADVNMVGSKNCNPIMNAKNRGRMDVIELLLMVGANVFDIYNEETFQQKDIEQFQRLIPKGRYCLTGSQIEQVLGRCKNKGLQEVVNEYCKQSLLISGLETLFDEIENSSDLRGRETLWKLLIDKLNEISNCGMLLMHMVNQMKVDGHQDTYIHKVLRLGNDDAKMTMICKLESLWIGESLPGNFSHYNRDLVISIVNHKDDGGQTTLHVAVSESSNSPIVIESLLKLGANINEKDQDGITALHLAVMNKKYKIADYLVIKGANTDMLDRAGKTPTQWDPSWRVPTDAVRGIDLLESGYRSPLTRSAMIFSTEKVLNMLKNNEAGIDDKDSNGETALIVAVKYYRVAMVEELLIKGANIEIVNNEGKTARILAKELGYEDIQNMLLFSEIIKSNDIKSIDLDKLMELIVRAPNINARYFRGNTILIWAAFKGYAQIVKLVLNRLDVNVNAQNQGNKTALMCAAFNGHVEIVRLLLNAKNIDIDVQDMEGMTALMYASKQERVEVVTLLVESGAQVQLKCSDGITAYGLTENREIKIWCRNDIVNPDLKKVLLELEKLVGMENLKLEIDQLVNKVIRNTQNGKFEKERINIILTGNPGTGKTTVARLIGKIVNESGMFKNLVHPQSKEGGRIGKVDEFVPGRFVEMTGQSLMGLYVGNTGPKVIAKFAEAYGGTIFLDEIYSLGSTSRRDSFGQQAITQILTQIENEKGNFVAIIGGYTRETRAFIESNPGLASRFNIRIELQDYNAKQMLEILNNMAKDNGFKLNEDAKKIASEYFQVIDSGGQGLDTKIRFGNARGVRNYFEQAVGFFACRIGEMRRSGIEPDEETKHLLIGADFLQKKQELVISSIYKGEPIQKPMLIDASDVNAQDERGTSTLMHAAFCGIVPVVRLLINRGANLKLINKDGYTAYNVAKDRRTKILCRCDINQRLKEVLLELEDLIGMQELKAKINMMIDSVIHGIGSKFVPRNIVLTGSPGTGKTTVARIIGKIVKELGMFNHLQAQLEKDHVFERLKKEYTEIIDARETSDEDRKVLKSTEIKLGEFEELTAQNLRGQYVGWSAPTVMTKFRKAFGGTVFLDEIYSLGSTCGSDNFAEQAVAQIIAEIENKRGYFVTIIGGYQRETDEFIKSNPGLASRFNIHIKLDDYTIEGLLEILNYLAKTKGYKLPENIEELAKRNFERNMRLPGFGNARHVEVYFENAVRKLESRLAEMKNLYQTTPNEDMMRTFVESDFLQSTPIQQLAASPARSGMSIDLL